jgi:membrane protease YdiL (CAAX protease family)
MSPLAASVLFTLFWALWHLPPFFYRPGYISMDAVAIAGWCFSLLAGRVLLTWMQNKSRGSILKVAVFHATIDIAFTSAATDATIAQYLGMLITLWGLATIYLLIRKKPSQAERLLVAERA